MSDAKFNITPQHLVHCWVQQYTYDNDFPSNFLIEVEMINAKFKITPLALPFIIKFNITPMTVMFSVFSNETETPVESG